MTAPSPSKAAYEAYAASTGGKTYDGRTMPTWNELPLAIRVAWGCAAEAARSFDLLPDTLPRPDLDLQALFHDDT